MKVVVTGGAGFLGSWIIKQLLEEGADVTVFDVAVFTGRWSLIMTPEQIARVTWVTGRIDEESFVGTLAGLAPDAVIHLAGVQIPTCRDNPLLGARVNILGERGGCGGGCGHRGEGCGP